MRQVVHHVPDSHMNAYIRFKLALTEDNPTIKPYDEAAWAQLADSPDATGDVAGAAGGAAPALGRAPRVDAGRRTSTVRSMHPEQGPITNDWLLQVYAWHGDHHVAHVTALRQREGW